MNGIHDIGGMQDMGPIQYERNEPVFHEAWEGRVYAITRALGAWGKWNIDASRYQIEVIPPADYLRMSYYERWLTRIVEDLVKHGLATREEIETGKPAPEALPREARNATPPLDAAGAVAIAASRANYKRPEANAAARFQTGERVRARNIHPLGHTRLPRYVRGKEGTIVRHHGVFVFPDTNAHFLGEQPQHLYSVRFAARELWGDGASFRDSVHLDLWESYLEPL
ncbi:MAG TPA: nitrile hydratase subunit beta [Bryobacteraceae bacterium]